MTMTNQSKCVRHLSLRFVLRHYKVVKKKESHGRICERASEPANLSARSWIYGMTTYVSLFEETLKATSPLKGKVKQK